jgi:uncharacterized phage protein (TIGR02218 family)
MPRSVPSALQTHLNGEVTSLATIWRITRRDGAIVRLTDHDADIIVPGDGTYFADTGFSRTAIEAQEGLRVDVIEVEGFISANGIDAEGIRRGQYNNARITIMAINWQAPADGVIVLRSGRLGDVIMGQSGRFQAELRSLTDLLNQRSGEVYSPTCRADVGDSRCKVPIEPNVLLRNQPVFVGQFFRVTVAAGTTSEAYGNLIYEVVVSGITSATQPTYNTTPPNTTVDGTATLKATTAWTRHGSVSSVVSGTIFSVAVTEPRANNGWFNNGVLTFESGPNTGLSREIKSWLSSGALTLHLPFPDIPGIGNAFRIHAGCDKLPLTCSSKFQIPGSRDFPNGNKLNFRGEDLLPGRDAIFTYPDAR